MIEHGFISVLIFQGGLPDVSFMTGGAHSAGFTGCISDLTDSKDSDVIFEVDSIGGVNVSPCS